MKWLYQYLWLILIGLIRNELFNGGSSSGAALQPGGDAEHAAVALRRVPVRGRLPAVARSADQSLLPGIARFESPSPPPDGARIAAGRLPRPPGGRCRRGRRSVGVGSVAGRCRQFEIDSAQRFDGHAHTVTARPQRARTTTVNSHS